MPRFAANLSMMYAEYDFLDRFEAAAQDGFRAVEFLFPYAYPVAEIAARLRANGLQLVLFNAPPGGRDTAAIVNAWERGERGSACLPGSQAIFRAGIEQAITSALAMACPRLHVMAGLAPAGVSPEVLHATYVDNLCYAAREAGRAGLEVLIEPINRRDMPGYFLTRQDQAQAVVQEVGSSALKVQMDLYHCQIVEGDVASKLRLYVPTGRVGHVQIAGVPQRNEPDTGELHYPYLLALLDELGYSGWVGCEYRPRRGLQPGATRSGLQWMRPWL